MFKAALMMGMVPQEDQESVFYKICIDPAKGMKDIPEYASVKEMVVRFFLAKSRR